MADPDTHSREIQLVAGDLRLISGLDARMLALLDAIDQTGSLSKAAKQVGLSYKGAWQIIERANNASPRVLVVTATGGSKGGGSQLTPAGKRLLDVFQNLQQQHQLFIQQLNQTLLADPELSFLLKPLAMKTSAGNQLFAQVVRIQLGAVSVELGLRLKSGAIIVANMDKTLFEKIGPKQGEGLLILVPAFEIGLYQLADAHSLSARNVLPVEVIRIDQDEVAAEIGLSLGAGDSLFASVTAATVESMALQVGQRLFAVFKSNAVILALPEKAEEQAGITGLNSRS